MTAWDDIRALFADNTDGDIGADDMRTQVTDLETLDALNAKLASPTFTGVPAAPTAAAATNTTQLATTAFVEAESVLLTAVDALKVNLDGTNLDYEAATGTTLLDEVNHVLECTTGTFTVTLPTAVGISGKQYIIKNSGAGTITVEGDGTEVIDGALNQTLNQYDSLIVMSNNVWWMIL